MDLALPGYLPILQEAVLIGVPENASSLPVGFFFDRLCFVLALRNREFNQGEDQTQLVLSTYITDIDLSYILFPPIYEHLIFVNGLPYGQTVFVIEVIRVNRTYSSLDNADNTVVFAFSRGSVNIFATA